MTEDSVEVGVKVSTEVVNESFALAGVILIVDSSIGQHIVVLKVCERRDLEGVERIDPAGGISEDLAAVAIHEGGALDVIVAGQGRIVPLVERLRHLERAIVLDGWPLGLAKFLSF